MKKILVIEDDPIIRSNILELLDAEGFEGLEASGGAAGIQAAHEKRPDLVICDIMMPDPDGYAVLGALRADSRTTLTPFIFLTAKADRSEIRFGMNQGADDYVTKPFTRAELLDSIRTRLDRAEKVAASMRGSQLEEGSGPDSSRHSWPDPSNVVVEDPVMRQMYDQVSRIAQSELSVLLLGENGVGKEIFALEVHRRSPRAKGPFLPINCAALPENLMESELFGYEKGAHSMATKQQKGLLESAEGGTVFLDEMGEMPPAMQAKLLRVLEERKITRVGGRTQIAIDVRFVAATNRDLEAAVTAGRFREDLFFRLNGAALTIPPLRERPSEIKGLANAFIVSACRNSKRSRPPTLSETVLEALQKHAWPGNVRELKQVVERAVVLCDGDRLEPQHLPQKLLARSPPHPPHPPAPAPATYDPSLDPMEKARQDLKAADKQRIIEALEKCGGHQGRAADLLGISRRTLVSRLKEYGIPRPRDQSSPGDDDDRDKDSTSGKGP